MPNLRAHLDDALRFTGPWKAPVPDGISTALYKTFKATKNYLFCHVEDTIEGRYRMTREDIQANIILLQKPATQIIKSPQKSSTLW